MNGLLKFITCGSVDDGKSTLIGHMLYAAKLLYADQKQALELDSRVANRGTIDYSLLLDGLMAEREQGITIDVAYRYFATDNRSFIVADTPGHEEYTRNMAVGASFADLAVILVDAVSGILVQTKRHARICALMGIRYFVFAVNKMDLARYDEKIFKKIEKDIKKLAIDLELFSVKIIPVSATEGDNIINSSVAMPWYNGGSLLTYLENVNVENETEEEGFVLPVQRVCRPDYTFRGFQGQVECGSIAVGDELTALPSGEKAHVKRLFNTDKKADEVHKGQSVTLCLDREIDVSRGCVFINGTSLRTSDLLQASILWMDDNELVVGRTLLLKLGTKMVPATVMKIKYRIDINNGEHISVTHLYKNEMAVCEIATAEKIVFDRFNIHKEMGRFILIDRVTNMTSACGTVDYEMQRSENIFWHQMDVTRESRAEKMQQKPLTLWFTGLSGSGKSTLANEVEKKLAISGKYTMLLDGDNVRMGLSRDLGFKEEDRIENIRRIAEVARLMNDAGLIVLTTFISPYVSDRENARRIIGSDNFIEIFVATPIEECEKRDVKGLYKKARNGQIPDFTGISAPYEKPASPQITVNTVGKTIEEASSYIYAEIQKYM